MFRAEALSSFVCDEHFVVRAPILPEGALTEVLTLQPLYTSDETQWKQALALQRDALIRQVESSEMFAWALQDASPECYASLRYLKNAPDSKKGVQAQRSLTRYFVRACTRATPFGAFAGVSVGRFTSKFDCFELEHRLVWRLAPYAFGIFEDRATADYVKVNALAQINDSTVRVVARSDDAQAMYTLLEVGNDEALSFTLSAAQSSIRIADLREQLMSHFKMQEVADVEIDEYISALIDAEILINASSRQLAITSGNPERVAHSSIDIPSKLVDHLEEVNKKYPTGVPPAYEKEDLGESNAGSSPQILIGSNLRQGLVRGALPTDLADSLVACLSTLRRIGASPRNESRILLSFRDRFATLYGERWVPLQDALDDVHGIGLDREANKAHVRAAFNYVSLLETKQTKLGTFHTSLLHCLLRNEDRSTPLQLDQEGFADSHEPKNELPDSFSLLLSIYEADTPSGLRVLLKGGAGPPAGTMTARFGITDRQLAELLKRQACAEEALMGGASFAELTIQPPGKSGHSLARNIAYSYEIACGHATVLPEDRQLHVRDLQVRVTQDGRILVRHAPTGVRVFPRLSSPLDFDNAALPVVFRFLCYLQYEPWLSVPVFEWGPLDNLEHLPRVMYKDILLSLETWNIPRSDIDSITNVPTRFEAFRAVQTLKKKRNLPDLVSFVEGDKSLMVDLRSALSVDCLLQLLKRSRKMKLQEVLKFSDSVLYQAGESYANEVLIFLRRATRATSVLSDDKGLDIPTEYKGSHGLFDQWVFFKIYLSPEAADRFVVARLLQVTSELQKRGLAKSWFFMRYADPHFHLRLRFQSDIPGAHSLLHTELQRALDDALATDVPRRFELAEYTPEVERYGGIDAMPLAETFFNTDSVFSCELLQASKNTGSGDQRLLIILSSVDSLISDAIPQIPQRLHLLQRIVYYLSSDLNVGPSPEEAAKLARKFAKLKSMGELPTGGESGECRSRSVSVCKTLLEGSSVWPDVTISFIHMAVNRLAPSRARFFEYIVCKTLLEHYSS